MSQRRVKKPKHGTLAYYKWLFRKQLVKPTGFDLEEWNKYGFYKQWYKSAWSMDKELIKVLRKVGIIK